MSLIELILHSLERPTYEAAVAERTATHHRECGYKATATHHRDCGYKTTATHHCDCG